MNLRIESEKVRGAGHGARGEALPILSHGECDAARRHYVQRLAALEWKSGCAAIVGTPDGAVDVVALSALCDAVERLDAWARAVGLVSQDQAAQAAAACPAIAAAVKARRELEAAEAEARRAAVDADLARLRRVSDEVASGERSPLGTAASRERRGERKQRAWSALSRAGLGPAFGPAAPSPISARADRASALLDRNPVGSVGWARAAGVDVGGFVPLSKLRRAKVRVNRHHRRRAAAYSSAVAPLAASGRVIELLAVVAKRGEMQAAKWVRGSAVKCAAERREVGPAAAADDVAAYFIRLQQEAAGIYRGSVLQQAAACLSLYESAGFRLNSRGRLWVVDSCAALGRRGGEARKAAEAWEYAAVNARDGREVGGGWALQGAVHGLRDFWLAASDSADADLVESDGVELHGEADHDEGQALGLLKSRPDSGEGSGMRPSVLASLDGWAAGIREAFAARVQAAAKGQAAIKAAESAARDADLVNGLACWARGGSGPASDLVASLLSEDRDALTPAARQRLKRLRDRGGVVAPVGPPLAAEVRDWRPSLTGDGLTAGAAAAPVPHLVAAAPARSGRWGYFRERSRALVFV